MEPRGNRAYHRLPRGNRAYHRLPRSWRRWLGNDNVVHWRCGYIPLTLRLRSGLTAWGALLVLFGLGVNELQRSRGRRCGLLTLEYRTKHLGGGLVFYNE